MTRELFERKLREMQEDVLIMGSMVEKAIQRSIEALRTTGARLFGERRRGFLGLRAHRARINCSALSSAVMVAGVRPNWALSA